MVQATREIRSEAREAKRDRLVALYRQTRARTERLAGRLTPEDQQLQSMPDASPTKWHRAHTTWFFETFVLQAAGVAPVDPRYAFLFNSYYEAAGPRHARPKRGMVSRPEATEIGGYRARVDERMMKLLGTAAAETLDRLLPIVELGIAHEEQHQELILTDILHAFSENPIHPAYLSEVRSPAPSSPTVPARFIAFDGGLREVGARDEAGFAFDNERPRHKVWNEPFLLADRLITYGELKAFLREGGYRTPSLWLQEGYELARAHGHTAPLYTTFEDGELRVFSLAGDRTPSDDEPAAHLDYYEADALAHFLGGRLPTEAEWEAAAEHVLPRGNFVDAERLIPAPAVASVSADAAPASPRQLFGDAWEWTSSGYDPYPGYQSPPGALGEYNGKFMVSQKVLRGGSCLTPERHVRASYRNFWHPHTRFQMTGARLARNSR